MLGKLLKYDLKFVYKSVWIFYVLVLLFSGLTRLFDGFTQTIIVIVFGRIFNGAAISFMFSAVINNMFACWRRFKSNLYGDESYLTHTLPVKKWQLYMSHFLNAFLTMLTSIAVSLLGIVLIFYSEEKMAILRALLKSMSESFESTPTVMILIFAILIFSQMLFVVQSGYTGLVIGHRSDNGKMGKSVIWGFVIYGLTQMIILGIVYIIALFRPDMMQMFTEKTVESGSTFKAILYIVGGLYLLMVGVCSVLDLKLLQKGVNVE